MFTKNINLGSLHFKPTATVLDKLLITTMESVWETHHHTEAEPDKTASNPSQHQAHSNEEHPDHHQDESHEEDAHEHETEDHPDSEESQMDLDITALLVKFKIRWGWFNSALSMKKPICKQHFQDLKYKD